MRKAGDAAGVRCHDTDTQKSYIIRVRYLSVYLPYLYHVYICMYLSKYRLVCLVCLRKQTTRILSSSTRLALIYTKYDQDVLVNNYDCLVVDTTVTVSVTVVLKAHCSLLLTLTWR